MRALIDTHAALWWLGDDPKLSLAARDAIATAGEPLISAGSLLEVSIKASLDKIAVPADWANQLLAEGFTLLAIDTRHAKALGAMPFIEVDGTRIRDPFDRLLVAQSKVESVPVVTRDPRIRAHGVPVIW